MKREKKLFAIFIACIIGSIAFANAKLENDLEYLHQVLTEAYVGYEYNEKAGFDLDKAIANVRNCYIEKAEEKGLASDELSDDLLAECINKEIYEKFKVADNHFGITSKKSLYGFKPQIWYSSKVYFTKKGNDYYVAFSLNPKVKRNLKYTGNEENLFPVIFFGKKFYVFGAFLDQRGKVEFSIDNKTYKTKMTVGNILRKHKSGHVGMKRTKKSVYLSISDCQFLGNNRKDHTLLFRKLDDYLIEIRKSHYENIIIDLRGNGGGIVGNITPVLQTINFEGDYKNLEKVTKKIKTFRSNNIKDSELIRKAKSQYLEENPAYKMFEVEDSTTEYYKNQPIPEYNFEPAYKGNVIILCDAFSASAAELFIAYSYMFENVYLIGTNTSGTIDFGGVWDYYLPESGIKLRLATESFKESAFLQNNPHWHGDKKGFYPDYWCTSNSILPTLISITKDKKLFWTLRGLRKHLL